MINPRDRFLIARAVLRECGPDAARDLRRLQDTGDPRLDEFVADIFNNERYRDRIQARVAEHERKVRIRECERVCGDMERQWRKLPTEKHAAMQAAINALRGKLDSLGDSPDEDTVVRIEETTDVAHAFFRPDGDPLECPPPPPPKRETLPPPPPTLDDQIAAVKREAKAPANPEPNSDEPFDTLLEIAQHFHRGHLWSQGENKEMRCVKAPLRKQHLRDHLERENPVGLCPISPGTSVTRAANLDMDSHKGEVPWVRMTEVAARIAVAASERGLNAIPFRSTGGSGIHLTFLWREPQDAYSVRETLREVLEGVGFKPGTKGVARGEVEVFPKQDRVPEGGYGNMWVLPMSRESVSLDVALFEPTALPVLTYSTPVAKREKPERPAKATPSDVDIAQVRAAVEALPAQDYDYEHWRNIVFAIHSATQGSDEGLELAKLYNAKHPHERGPEWLVDQVWPYIRDDGTITAGTLFHFARKAGWQDPEATDGFEDSGPQSAKPSQAAFNPTLRSAAYLLSKEFKPMTYTIKNLLPEGVYLLAANPKVGKSWLALQIALAVASGGTVLNECATLGRVLFLALEDGERRLQSRLRKLDAQLLSHDARERLQFEITWPRIGAGGGEAIEQWLTAHPEARLVVIDVLERIRPARNAKANAYGEDYEALKELKAIAERRQITILVVHHTRKAASDDAMQLVSGTHGLTGGADGMLVLMRAREAERGELHVAARDLEHEGAYAVAFKDARWTMLGRAVALAKTAEQQAILDALREGTEDGEPMQLKDIAGAVGKRKTTVQNLLAKLVRDGQVTSPGRGQYAPVKAEELIGATADDLA